MDVCVRQQADSWGASWVISNNSRDLTSCSEGCWFDSESTSHNRKASERGYSESVTAPWASPQRRA